MHHIGPEAAEAGLHLAALGMLAQMAGKPQKAKGILQSHVVGFAALRQGSPLGFGGGLTRLAELEIGAVLAEQQVDRFAGLGIHPNGFGAIGLLLEDQLGPIRIEVGRGDLHRQGGLEQLLAAIVGHPLLLQIGPETADPHHAGQALQFHGAGDTGVDVALALQHLGFEPLLALVEALQVGQPLHLAGGDLIEAALHPGCEAGIDQIRKMFLQQGGHREGGEAGGEGIVLKRGVTAVHDRADDRGVGGRAADALLLKHLHQGRLAIAGGGLGVVTEGLYRLTGGGITHLQGRQQHLLSLQGGVGVVTALHVGAEEAGEVDPLAAGAEQGRALGAPGSGL